MLRSVMVAMVLGAGLIPGLAQVPEGAPAARPAWLETLPEVPGRLYGMGTADLGALEGQAITRASDAARLEVVTRLRATVKGQTSAVTRTTERQAAGGPVAAFGDREVRASVSVSAQAEDLPGLVVERTYLDHAGRSAYALAYLDLAQAESTLASRLAGIAAGRARVGGEVSRQARWRLRGLQDDLDRLEATLDLLSVTGTGLASRAGLQAERAAVAGRLAALAQAELPPLDFSKLAVRLRTNLDLPPGIEAYLIAQLTANGLVYRPLNPDLILALTFLGGPRGPELIYADVDVYQGLTYRLDVNLQLLEGGGTALARPAPIQIIQGGSPEGLVNAFRKQFERHLPRLLAEFRRAWE